MAETAHSYSANIRDKGRVLSYDGKSAEFRLGARHELSTTNEFFSHFNKGSTIPPGLTLTQAGTPVAAATYGTGLGGTAVITTDDVLGTASSLTTQLLWQADRQSTGVPLVFECKVKVGTIATREFWFGISDAVADTDPYALSTTSTFTTSVPTDAAVIGYSATPTSGAAFTAGGNEHVSLQTKADVDSVVAKGGGAFATATNYTYRIEIDSNGGATYFVDGKFHSRSTAALTKTVPLSAVAYATPRTSAGSSEAVMTIDYFYVGGM